MIAVAGGAEAAAAVKAALDGVARARPGAVAVGELHGTAADAVEPAPTAAVELERLRQAAALGGVAVHWRHTLNNSLAALLAEAQLLGMESQRGEAREGIERIIALCRRMIIVLRDGPPTEPSGMPPGVPPAGGP
jgi:signal transduction histidine kinase